MTWDTSNPHAAEPAPQWLWALALVSVIAGTFARFNGIGLAPLGVDEFYASRSVDNILRTGLPEFLCGGYYNRGPLFQYVVAMWRSVGLTPETAGRSVAALSSLALLPAVYVLGRNLHSKVVGLLAVIVLSLSIWEIEIARFGRMYTPFQAVFAWYLVSLLHHLRHRDRTSLFTMIGLSLLAVVIWEGGALIGLINFLPAVLHHRDGKLDRNAWWYLLGFAVLFAVLYALSTIDLRTSSAVPAYAQGYSVPHKHSTFQLILSLRELQHRPLWLAMACLPGVLAMMALRWVWQLRARWMAALGLLALLGAALAHQFLIAGALLLLLLLARLVGWRDFVAPRARWFVGTLVAAGLFWFAFSLTTAGDSLPMLGRFEVAARTLFGFPDVITNVAWPWARTVPLLSLCFGGAIAGLAVWCIAQGERSRIDIVALLIASVLVIFAVGATSTDRHETRYLFFFFPVFYLLALIALARAIETRVAGKPLASIAVAVGALAAFVITEDFQFDHMRRIDSTQYTYRLNMRPALVEHYYPHNDARGAGEWLTANAAEGDVVILGIPSIDQYSSRADYFFLDDVDDRYEAYACQRGTIERWTSKPLLSGIAMLQSQIASGQRVLLVMYPSFAKRLFARDEARDWPQREAWASIDGGIRIFEFDARPTQ